MKRLLYLSILLLTSIAVVAENRLIVGSGNAPFMLASNGTAATVVVSEAEPLVVQKAAALFSDDVCRVTGIRPVVSRVSASKQKGAVVIATIGHNAYVDRLISKGRLDVSSVRGAWERFIIKMVGGRLLIVGSDPRGTAYGVLTLSEEMGVSPWYWWADVPVCRQSSLFVDADYLSQSPTVKYRGIFINDEDWGLKPWAAKNYERELGDIGPKTYARVCELLLRLKANMLAPAMHSCTGAFYSHPESKVVADSFGIIITTSHCEPLLLNNAAKSEWNQERDGDWNYKTNRGTIVKKWDDRLAEAARFENIYTVAMRGVHDAGLRGNLPMEERVPLIEQVISDQRKLLETHLRKNATEIPQIFVPYKETMDIYENGLRVPDDITLVWVDDNYGYMKRVSNPKEQQRSGRSGVYYHLSYLGAPHDYLWLNTTPPVLMYEELKKAYDTGADRYWLLNVGDIKPMELGMQTFFDMAWNINAFNFETVYRHQAECLARLFGLGSSVLQPILDDYYRLAWSRKPEFMGWEYQWDDKAHTGLKPTAYSFRNYDEAQRRLADYQRISDEVERIGQELRVKSKASVPAFFELLQFPVQAAYQMNRKFLMAQLNQEMVGEGRLDQANWASRQTEEAYDSINALNRRYNEQLDGKWRGMMALSTSFTTTAMYYQKPEVTYTSGAGEQAVSLAPLRGTTAEDCYVIDLARFAAKSSDVRIVKGLGYDGQVVQLGDPTGGEGMVSYRLPEVPSDSVDVIIYNVPFWPLYEGKSNRIGVTFDGALMQVFENSFREYDRTWKDQVMRNGIACRLRFPVNRSESSHLLVIKAFDSGQMVQRIIIDWGGLQPSYIGPEIP